MKNLTNILMITCIGILSNCIFADTIAYWKFNEMSGQTVANSEGSETMALRAGNNDATDAFDTMWSKGLLGGAMRGKLYSAYGGSATGNVGVKYLSQASTWSGEDANSIAPTHSYSIEVVFNPYSTVSWGNDVMGMMYCKDLTANAIKYLLRHHSTSFTFYVNGTNYIIDLASLDMTIELHKWYYIGVIFDETSSNLDIVVRDLASEQTVSKSFTASPISPMVAPASSYLLVMSEGTSGRSFDGLFDELRISNTVVPEQDRLYNTWTAADWGYQASDISKDGYTGIEDIALLAQDWLRCSNPQAAGCEDFINN